MKTITNFTRYIIDKDGDIYSTISNKFLKLSVMPSGYQKVTLRNDEEDAATFLVHRLVAIHFIPNPNNLREVNHIDGNKENNCIDNLEWCTRKENIQPAERIGLMYHPSGINHPQSKAFFQFDLKGNLLKYWECVADCARYLFENDDMAKKEFSNLKSLQVNISHNLNMRHLSCCGYIFSFYPKIDIQMYKELNGNYQKHKSVMATNIKDPNDTYIFDVEFFFGILS